MTTTDAHRAIEAVWRIESPRLVAGLTRIVRDISLAEELAQDALVVALPGVRAAGGVDGKRAGRFLTPHAHGHS